MLWSLISAIAHFLPGSLFLRGIRLKANCSWPCVLKRQGIRWFMAICLSCLLVSCTVRSTPQVQHAYQVFTPSPTSNTQVQFEYPVGWRIREFSDADFTQLTLCAPWPKEVATPRGRYTRCSNVIQVTTYLADANTPDLETAINRGLEYGMTTPDYALVRRSVTINGYTAQRIELCFNSAGYEIPVPPIIRHDVYFEVGLRIYIIITMSDFVSRPCDPSTAEFSEFHRFVKGPSGSPKGHLDF